LEELVMNTTSRATEFPAPPYEFIDIVEELEENATDPAQVLRIGRYIDELLTTPLCRAWVAWLKSLRVRVVEIIERKGVAGALGDGDLNAEDLKRLLLDPQSLTRLSPASAISSGAATVTPSPAGPGGVSSPGGAPAGSSYFFASLSGLLKKEAVSLALAALVLIGFGLGLAESQRRVGRQLHDVAARLGQVVKNTAASTVESQDRDFKKLAEQLKAVASSNEDLVGRLGQLVRRGAGPPGSSQSAGPFVFGGSQWPSESPSLRVPFARGGKAVVLGVSHTRGKEEIFAAEAAERFSEEVLVKLLGFRRDSIKLLTDKPAAETDSANGSNTTRQQVTAQDARAALRWLRQVARPEDFVVLFVACHGDKTAAGEDRPPELAFRLSGEDQYAAAEMLSSFVQVPSQLKLAVVDTCFSGLLEDLAARARTQAERAMGDGQTTRPYMPIILSSASSLELSTWYRPERIGVFQAALLESLFNAAEVERVKDGQLEPWELREAVQDRAKRILDELAAGAEAPIPDAPHVGLYTENMGRFPLFAHSPQHLPRLTLVGTAIQRSQITISGTTVEPGLNLLRIPWGGYYWLECFQEEWEGGATAVTIKCSPGWAADSQRETIRVVVKRPNQPDWEKEIRAAEMLPHKVVHLPRVTEPQARPAQHSPLRITRISQQEGRIAGIVDLEKLAHGDDAGPYEVLVTVKTDVYYPHPYVESRASIMPGGRWEVEHIVRGSERSVAAVLIPKGKEIQQLDRLGYVTTVEQLRPFAAFPDAITEVSYLPEYSAERQPEASVRRPVGNERAPLPLDVEPRVPGPPSDSSNFRSSR